jgi:hypothetical protein
MNVVAARGLSTFSDPKIGKLIVNGYKGFRSPFRPQIISMLASRTTFASDLVDAIRDGKIPREDLSPYQVRQIHGFGDQDLSRRLSEVWGEVRDSSEEKIVQIQSLKQKLSQQQAANRSEGRALFAKHCQNCHRLYGEGAKIGPDLTGGDRGNLA